MKMPAWIAPSLTHHWLIWFLLVFFLLAYIPLIHFWGQDHALGWDESQREFIRSVLYVVAILLFPFTNVLRYILLRLDCTMPGNKPATQRYFSTVVSCLLLIESVAVFGVAMKFLGDDFNTFYIFEVLGGLGLFLHRPKSQDLAMIEQALAEKSASSA